MTTTYGDDEALVEMRIRYDIPDDAAPQIAQLASATSDLQANLEAATRFNREQVEQYQELVALSDQILAFKEYAANQDEASASALERQVLARNTMDPTAETAVDEFTGEALPSAVIMEPRAIRTVSEVLQIPIPEEGDRVAPSGRGGEAGADRPTPESASPDFDLPERTISEPPSQGVFDRVTPPGESGDAEEGLRFMRDEYATEETLGQILEEVRKSGASPEDVTRADLTFIPEAPVIPEVDPTLEEEVAETPAPDEVSSGGEGFTRDAPEGEGAPAQQGPDERSPADAPAGGGYTIPVEGDATIVVQSLPGYEGGGEDVAVAAERSAAPEGVEGSVSRETPPAAEARQATTVREAISLDELERSAGAEGPIPVDPSGVISFTGSEVAVPVLGERGLRALPEAWDGLAQEIPFLEPADNRGVSPDGAPDDPLGVDGLFQTLFGPKDDRVIPGEVVDDPQSGGRTSPESGEGGGSGKTTEGGPRVTPEGTPGVDPDAEARTLGERVEELGRRFRSDAENTSSALGASDVGDLLGTAQNFLGGEGLLGAAPGGAGRAIAAGATKALPWVGGAYLAYQGVNSLKQQTAELTNLGMEGGGGFQEGVGYQMAIQQMALNPMLTTQQSKQIVMTALSEGYTGKEFDTMTQFMADNMTEMNLSVNDSVKLLRANVEQGGQSVKSLGTQLETLNTTVGKGASGRAEMQETFVNLSQQGVGMGMGGSDAGRFGMVGANLFQEERYGGNNMLAGRGGDILGAMASNQAVQSRLAAEHDIPYWEVADRLGSEGVYEREMMELLAEDSKRPAFEGKPRAFAVYLQQMYGLQLNDHEAKELQAQLREGNPVEAAEETIKESAQTTDRNFETRAEDVREQWVGNARVGLGAIGRAVATPFSWLTGGSENVDTLWRGWHEDREKVENFESGIQGNVFGMRAGGTNPMLETLVRNYGTSNLYLEEDGERISLEDLDFMRDDVRERVDRGRIVVQEDGKNIGSGTLEEFALTGGPQEGEGVYTGNPGGTIGLTPQAAKLVELMEGNQPTKNQLQAFTAADGATLNDPPVGDR